MTRTYQRRQLNLAETEKAYIAAIIDGEGWITFTRDKCRTRPNAKWMSCQIGISSTSEALHYWLKEKLSSLALGFEIKQLHTSQKQGYNLRVTGIESVCTLLEQIIPYMIIKRDRAQIMLDFTSSRIGLKVRTPYSTDPMVFATRIWGLNQKGRFNPSVKTEEPILEVERQ